MNLGSFLFGEEAGLTKKSAMAPQQMQILSQLLGGLGGKGGQGGGLQQILQLLQGQLEPGSEAEQAYAAPMMRQFQEQTLPGIAERFAGAGALSSSGFGQSLSSAGAGLQENLSQMRQGVQQNALQQIMQLLGTGLGAQPYAFGVKQASPGFLAQAAAGAAKGYGGMG